MEFVTTLFSQQLGIWSALLLILIATSKYLISLITNHFTKNPKRHKLPPGPKPWPIVGNLPEMLLNRPVFRWIHNIMDKMDTEIACIRLGNVHVIPVTSPSIACEFLRKQDSVFASRPLSMSTELVSSGYLTTILAPFGEQWKKMRKVVTNELLSPSKLAWLHDQRLEEADNLIQYVYNQCKTGHNGLVNVRIAAQHYCGNVIRRMVFNRRYFGKERKDGGPGIDEVEHVDAIFTLLKNVYAFSVSDFTPCLRRFDLDGRGRLLTKALAIVRKYHDPIIEERLQRWKDGTKQDKEDLLDVLITLKDANNNSLLTTEEIKAQIIDLMIASVDNPSNAVEWTIAETINQPELLERATKELDRVVGKKRQVQESDLSKLNYVKACARESFRLHPIFALNPPHVSMADAVVASYFIPKGSHVCVSRLGLGRNPKVWKEPLKFKPERHLKSDDSDVSLAEPDLNILSFSTGRRGCPGVMLGTTMTVMLLARLLHGFSWSALPNESGVDLAESKDGTSLAKPLLAMAKPRLPSEWYLSD